MSQYKQGNASVVNGSPADKRPTPYGSQMSPHETPSTETIN